MWNYNGEDDTSRCGRKGPDTPAALAKILAELFKGEEEEFLHIAGYVALCELFLGCEAHFELWRKLFCLVLRNYEGSIFEVGGAEV